MPLSNDRSRARFRVPSAIRTRLAACVLAACVAVAAGGARSAGELSGLPSLDGVSAQSFNSIEEQRLGRQFMRSALAQMEFIEDPEVVGYVRELGERLLSAAELPVEAFEFNVIDDPALNAFAVPGGFITVHTGLIERTDNEGELSSVLAHEIAHITQRHITRMIARSKERSLPAVAAMVAAILVGGQVGSAAMVGTNAALAADQLRYSRDFEKEADAVGIRILAAADFPTGTMPEFFQKLEKDSSLYGSEVPEYLRTHPLSVDRIADSEARAAEYPDVERGSSMDYYLVRARVRAMTADNPAAARDYFVSRREEAGLQAVAARYGEALALMNGGNYDAAASLLSELAGRYPNNAYFPLAEGQVAMRRGDAAGAVEVFETLYASDPDSAVTSSWYAEALIAAGRLQDARKVVRKWQREDPRNPDVYRLSSRVEGELGRTAEAFQARAEYFALRFQVARAIEELDRAREHAAGNYYLESSIDARRRELREELERFDEQARRN